MGKKGNQKGKGKKGKKSDDKKRAWCFTLNNYTAEEEKRIKGLECKYLVFGRETGDKGTPHLQGYIYFRNARHFKATKKLLGGSRVHLEAAIADAEVNHRYCTKGGDVFEKGDLPLSQKEKGLREQARWETIKDLAQKGMLDLIEPQVFINCYRSLKQISVDYAERPPDLHGTCGIWYFGESGAGKTTLARTAHGTNYFLKAPTKWWDSYQADRHPIVILDDLDPYHKALGYHIKMWADKWSFVAEIKGSSQIIRPKLFIITSQYLPADIWDDQATVQAVQRRFRIVDVSRDSPPKERIYTDSSNFLTAEYDPPKCENVEPQEAVLQEEEAKQEAEEAPADAP